MRGQSPSEAPKENGPSQLVLKGLLEGFEGFLEVLRGCSGVYPLDVASEHFLALQVEIARNYLQREEHKLEQFFQHLSAA